MPSIDRLSSPKGPLHLPPCCKSLHPNYWGELALRNCVRQAYNGGVPKSGTCVRGANGLNGNGEPNMVLQ